MLRIALCAVILNASIACGGETSLLLEAKIPLGNIEGRIDHLAIDLSRQRLFVAELGNNSVGVVDLTSKTVRTLTGLSEPQGVAYVATTDTLYVSNGGNGTLRLYKGSALASAGQISLGADADNVRYDAARNRIWIGHGSGALTDIDAVSQSRVATFSLPAHPESFQLDPTGTRIFVNVPDAHKIVVIDGATRAVTAWSTGTLRGNFPMMLDPRTRQLWVAYRDPARLDVLSMDNGSAIESLDTCGDADDVFLDPHRDRVYVVCGEGVVEAIGKRNDRYQRLGRILTSVGARTALFVPELDRLFVAVRKSATESASIWVLRPQP
jgi:DNA-binding beta-propeller fold protein YncE